MIDVVHIEELIQTEVDPRNHATTVHTGLKLPDGGEGFLIIGRVVREKKQVWEPLKSVIIKVLIEYDPKFDIENSLTTEENNVHPQPDYGREAGD